MKICEITKSGIEHVQLKSKINAHITVPETA